MSTLTLITYFGQINGVGPNLIPFFFIECLCNYAVTSVNSKQ